MLYRGAAAEYAAELEGTMPVIRHAEQPLRSGFREIVTRAAGAEGLTLWDQVLEPGTQIPARAVHGVRNTGARDVHLLACFPASAPQVFDPGGHEL